MAAKLHFRIFDSGIDFTSSPISTSTTHAKDIINTINKISITAAFSINTSMAIMFGTKNYCGKQLDQNENKYYFGHTKIEVEDGDDVELSDTAFIGFFQKYNYNQEEDFNLNNFSSILIPKSFDLDSAYMLTHPNTLTTYDTLTCLREIELRVVDQQGGTLIDQDVVSVLYTTFLQIIGRNGHYDDPTAPAFIPVSNYNGYCSQLLKWINKRSENFFNCLSLAADKMNISIYDLRLYVLLLSVYPENIEELPMSTIQSISLY